MKRTTLAMAFVAITTGVVGALASCSSDDNPAPSVIPSNGGRDSDAPREDSGCASDADTCNSCVSPVENPYNACSPAAGNCVRFDNGRVPQDTYGGIPLVP
jgi:hypothetical protein